MSNVAPSTKPRIVADAPAAQPDEVRRAKSGSRGVFILGLIGVCTSAAVFGYRALTAGEQTTDDAMIDADVVPVSMRVSGVVSTVKVEDNARVHKGDVLLQLDSTELAARVKQAESELAAARAQALIADAQQHVVEASARGGLSSAQAQVSASRAQVSSASAQIEAARAQLNRAQAEADFARTDVEHNEQMYAAKAIARDRLDSSRTANDAAHAALAAARAQLEAAEQAQRIAQSRVAEASGTLDVNRPIEAKIAAATGSAQVAHARVGAAEAALDLARLALSYATVRAPVDGIVSRLSVHEGQLLGLNQSVASIVPEMSYVIANFKETQIGQMRRGQQVSVEVDAFPGRELHGVVSSLAGGTGSRFSLLPPDNASGNFVKVVQRVPVRIDWADLPSGVRLLPGMSVSVTVHTES